MKDFVINWGKTFLFWSSVFDLLVTIILIFATLAGAFTFVENVNPILMGFVIILAYMILFISPKFALYLFIDIRDQLKLIAQNTTPQSPQIEQTSLPKEESFLNKGLYSK